MEQFKDLRIVDNFYQTSSFFPMPTVLVSTVSESGQTNCGSYSLCFPYYIAGKSYYAMILECRNSSNTAQNILRTKKCALNFIPDDRKYFREAVRLGFPGDTTAEKMKNCLFTLKDSPLGEVQYIPELSAMQRREVIQYLKLISDEPKITSIYYVSCDNGLLDIRTKSLTPYTADIFLSNKIPTSYDDNAYDVNVDKMLNKISCNSKEIRALLEEMIGYCLIPTSKFQKAFILYGDGSNGKSSFLDMVIALLGETNVSSLSLKELNHNFKLSEITSKMANIGDDISDEYLTDSSIFKKLVTGEEITVDKKNEQPYKIRNYAKMIFAANNLPATYDKSNGMMRRLAIIPFNAVIKKTDKDYDPFIIDKLTTENAKSYLLKLAVDGIRRVFENNKFTEPQEVIDMINEYSKENNNVLQFLDNVNVIDRESSAVYDDYKYWCAENGVMNYKIRKFNAEIRSHTDLDLVIEKIGGKATQIWRKR